MGARPVVFDAGITPGTLAARVEAARLAASAKIDGARRAELGQFFTPASTARRMASMVGDAGGRSLRLLEAGAGVGSLVAAVAAELAVRARRPSRFAVTAYEIDRELAAYLGETLEGCRILCERAGIAFTSEVLQRDFLEEASGGLPGERFDCAILNPPYRKIRASSRERALLREAGIETSNLYAGFVALAARLLAPGGELVAITPRSFCNGPYFRAFRRDFLASMSLRRIHVYDARDRAFEDDRVLQENVIVCAVQGGDRTVVEVSASDGPDDEAATARLVPYAEVVDSRDPDRVIHVAPEAPAGAVAAWMRCLPATLDDLGISVSTGRVVDFRAREHLRSRPGPKTVPLLYPAHLRAGDVSWPGDGKKPCALVACDQTERLIFPRGVYTLVKRFSSKEERRRIVATVYRPAPGRAGAVAFENHLNVFHRDGAGLPRDLAAGLAAFLGSAPVDRYFRQFSGHTQVNATDLRSLRYPPADTLARLGRRARARRLDQDALDTLVTDELAIDGVTHQPRST